ncbi:hypothetical protein [Hymenobacter metallicola]|uniref:Uncharacterized protein n=1 Tax=Hymenobacter metallicola TaxID=2563114 RepID=A0A4Z0QGC2_9BACT|nr:hypothetical protein [Hymenobacter metallicola]TGE29108.1 hypothetical protein E5K02_06535 [Hymenobacter metallicola]
MAPGYHSPNYQVGPGHLLPRIGAGPASDTVMWAHLQPFTRAPWQGTLTYLDYRSQQPVTLVTKLSGRESAPLALILDFTYPEPNGQQVRSSEKLLLTADGQTLT